MILRANFPAGREVEGTLYLGGPVLYPCYGRAARDTAVAAHNPTRDPRRPFGDHPLGIYRVVERREIQPSDAARFRSYGRWFFLLDPIAGEAWEAKRGGRSGIGIHAGALDVTDIDGDGLTSDLRVANGCLRTTQEATDELARLWDAGVIGVGTLVHSGVQP